MNGMKVSEVGAIRRIVILCGHSSNWRLGEFAFVMHVLNIWVEGSTLFASTSKISFSFWDRLMIS